MEYFDGAAAEWDAHVKRNEAVIREILDHAEIRPGIDVLDVACGTGVLIPDYLARSVATVTGVDFSAEMIRIASHKFPQENVRFFCNDMESVPLDCHFDSIMVYNAFPHFPEPERLIRRLISFLKPGGTLSVAHGMSRKEINRVHMSHTRCSISSGLMSEDELAALFAKELEVTCKISNEAMYQVVGRKPAV